MGVGALGPVADDLDASWIRDALLPFEAFAVGSLVPVTFESYGRILHPAWKHTGEQVTWAAISAWSGRRVHALAEFEPVASPHAAEGLAPFDRRPCEGALPRDLLRRLCDVLATHTSTPDTCFVGVWEGYGWVETWRHRTLRLSLPERVHLVMQAPLDSVDEVGWIAADGTFIAEAPSIVWPVDRAWFVSSDVDQDSTFLGGSRSLLESLVADNRLEVWPVRPTDPICAGSDDVNRSP